MRGNEDLLSVNIKAVSEPKPITLSNNISHGMENGFCNSVLLSDDCTNDKADRKDVIDIARKIAPLISSLDIPDFRISFVDCCCPGYSPLPLLSSSDNSSCFF